MSLKANFLSNSHRSIADTHWQLVESRKGENPPSKIWVKCVVIVFDITLLVSRILKKE